MSNDIFTAGSLEKGNKNNKTRNKINDVIFFITFLYKHPILI